MTKFIDQMFEDTGLLQYSDRTEQGISKAEAKVIADYVYNMITDVIDRHWLDMSPEGDDGYIYCNFDQMLKEIEAKVTK